VLQGYLVDETDGRRVPIENSLVVGRTRECGFTIDDAGASRRHFEIIARDAGASGVEAAFLWKDLGSTNGTLVNGKRVLAGELSHGDCLQVGETVLRFEIEEAPDPPPDPVTTNLFQKTLFDMAGLAQPVAESEKSASLLDAVYRVMNEIASNYDPCELIDRILEVTLRAINAQRGAIFLAGDDDNLLPCPVCGHVHSLQDGVARPAESDEIRISRTVAKRVISKGESVLYQDSGTDNELNVAESIVALSLRSIICVPLRAKEGILGILYIDTNRVDQSYTQEDMLLAAAVGNSAGLAIENARMHREILEKQRIEQEIATAWIIQEGFLVKEWPNADPRFEIYGETRPAKTVGGDFYDYVQPAPDVVGMLIGDVSGKGVPAALTMAQLIAEFRLHARGQDSPAVVLRALNAAMSERSQRGFFCTICYIILDLKTGAVVCANAGHSPVLRKGHDGVSFFGEPTGPPVGILPEGPWQDESSKIDPGDVLLLYTDGIIEARSVKTAIGKEHVAPIEYDTAGLTQFLEWLPDASPRAMIEAINDDIIQFCAPLAPHDDCTMIAVRYRGNEN
jgi:phosphoserine phosphatase RsbU/P